eukprot:TRINITY_DN16110_c0_g1_i1.p1 TRINITY_DN16110_c0_g1~~TRINITY_DN16110_c0_g1_i1.p1  ORF type:complete len:276 (+),score=30.95 TRINITY_DN16110_c0_g1_i1:279-1106(+)
MSRFAPTAVRGEFVGSGAATPAESARSRASEDAQLAAAASVPSLFGRTARTPSLPSRPAGFSTTRDGVSLARSMSNPDGVTSACGLPAYALLNSTAVGVPSVAPCLEKRRDATLGYRGFIPGIKSETVFGAEKPHANMIATMIRPHAGPDDGGREFRAFNWACAPDYPEGRRPEATCAAWARCQQACPPVLNGGKEPAKNFGQAMQGYSGHRSLRLGRPRSGERKPGVSLNDTLERGGRLSLNHTMRSERECQPWDRFRSTMPGYSGHIRGKAVA